MASTMKIDGLSCAIGVVNLNFQYFLNDGPPHAWLDIHSDSKDAHLAGVAINCLDIGDIPRLEDIFERRFFFEQTNQADEVELGESVFWKTDQETLEVSSIQLQFGALQGDLLPLEIIANCFDHEGNQNISVSITGEATVTVSR